MFFRASALSLSFLEASFSSKLVPFEMGRASLLSIFIRLLRLFFGDSIGGVDRTCYCSNFCSIFVCFKYAGKSECFSEKRILSRLDACSNKDFYLLVLNSNLSLRRDTWPSRWFINISDWLNGVLVIGALDIGTSLFQGVCFRKKCLLCETVKLLNQLIFQELKFFFYIESISQYFLVLRDTLFKTKLLSIRDFKCL